MLYYLLANLRKMTLLDDSEYTYSVLVTHRRLLSACEIRKRNKMSIQQNNMYLNYSYERILVKNTPSVKRPLVMES